MSVKTPNCLINSENLWLTFPQVVVVQIYFKRVTGSEKYFF